MRKALAAAGMLILPLFGLTACGTPDLQTIATQNNCSYLAENPPDELGHSAMCQDGREVGVFDSNKKRDEFVAAAAMAGLGACQIGDKWAIC